jgi:hypothetical protein
MDPAIRPSGGRSPELRACRFRAIRVFTQPDDACFFRPSALKPVHVVFDGGQLPSDAGVLELAESERGLELAERLARSIAKPRAPQREGMALPR